MHVKQKKNLQACASSLKRSFDDYKVTLEGLPLCFRRFKDTFYMPT